MKRLLGLSTAIFCMATACGYGAMYSFPFTTGTITTTPAIVNGGAGVNTAGAVGRARAFYVTGDWTNAGGGAWSNEFRVQIPGATNAGGGPLDRTQGGAGNSNPYTFGHPSVATWVNNTTTSPALHGYTTMLADLPSSDLGGIVNLALRQSFSGSSANLANAQVHFLTDCMPPTAFDTAATGLVMTQRPSSLTTLTSVGTYTYQTLTFTAPATGAKHLAMHISPDFDGFLLVYGPGGFNPTTPLANLIGLDDIGSLGDSKSSDLFIGVTAGQQYTLVATTFASTPAGVKGTFTVAGIPEPSAWGMMLLGLGCLVAARRR